ncbi:protein NRT1/ PTR FAMILY 5.6-like [Tripterygium wilfordii]|uniref:Protein NRT1/ PTR FAMILY 5.6-like n=1 Tax=Tripterygium wilfordii TaxID=458696 RepID=A0A7J7C6Z4_TRIWF|nr:protein NRT1/ PTR FAMILY 5.6-like [Tripterygium wilfordii]
MLINLSVYRFLDKAAILEEKEIYNNPWRLATVTKVEELKLVLNMIPIWLTSLMFGICLAQPATIFVKQGATMNRRIGTSFIIPSASIYTFAGVGTIISVTIYEKILVPFLRNSTGNERGISILKRVGIGMIFSALSMAVAALVERERLKIAEKENVVVVISKNGSLSMSVFWLVPQYMILAIADGFPLVGLQEYFYDQVPDYMRSLGLAFYLSVIGVGSFLSNFLIMIADHVTGKSGKSWFGKDLNTSRLDNFYWLLAVLTLLNLCAFVVIARRYQYKNVPGRK